MQREAEKRCSKRINESKLVDRDAAKAEMLSREIEQRETSLERIEMELAESTSRLRELDEIRRRTEDLRALMVQTRQQTISGQMKSDMPNCSSNELHLLDQCGSRRCLPYLDSYLIMIVRKSSQCRAIITSCGR